MEIEFEQVLGVPANRKGHFSDLLANFCDFESVGYQIEELIIEYARGSFEEGLAPFHPLDKSLVVDS